VIVFEVVLEELSLIEGKDVGLKIFCHSFMKGGGVMHVTITGTPLEKKKYRHRLAKTPL